MKNFELISDFKPSGDQPQAIKKLIAGIKAKQNHQVLLGVTGSGKTFTVANVIQELNMPTLILSPNKTLAAQLYVEFKNFFPNNPVEYFISYYDYYQPEAYIPHTDTYIEKDSSVNEEIDRLRLKATASLLENRNCIVVASVSCIYGLGDPEDYENMISSVKVGEELGRDRFVRSLVDMQYARNEIAFSQGTFRVKGDVVDVFPSYLENAVRVEFEFDEVVRIYSFDPLTGDIIEEKNLFSIYPAKHFVISRLKREKAVESIRAELKERLNELTRANKLVEAQRLEQRTFYDIEMLLEVGYCNGIENYSRHLSGRAIGSRPYCLLDYFPKPFLMVIDESHIAVSQVRGMYNGDRARKQTLVDYGFRLPSALDNRPLQFDEFEKLISPVIYVSATPGDYEIEKSRGKIIEQIIRPTGLVDPEIEIRPTKDMIKDVSKEIEKVAKKKQRALITTLTKRMAEDLTQYMTDHELRSRYIHSDIDALKRIEILTEFREGKFDCLVGINLLREGLDLPEVALVVIMDADKEGFLRSERSIIQTCGRAARNVDGRIIMYADEMTGSMDRAISEMKRRRGLQLEYNRVNKITPKSIQKNISYDFKAKEEITEKSLTLSELRSVYGDEKNMIKRLEEDMRAAAQDWDFERAIALRDEISKIKNLKGKNNVKKIRKNSK